MDDDLLIPLVPPPQPLSLGIDLGFVSASPLSTASSSTQEEDMTIKRLVEIAQTGDSNFILPILKLINEELRGAMLCRIMQNPGLAETITHSSIVANDFHQLQLQPSFEAKWGLLATWNARCIIE